jgi:hydroxymethylpyrimidine pyrophosphatase-like HAD family hydrolase
MKSAAVGLSIKIEVMMDESRPGGEKRPFQLLACDYDGTLATEGAIPETAMEALLEARNKGCRLALVTGRGFDELRRICPWTSLFEVVIAENGGVIYWPEREEVELRGAPPAGRFLEALNRRGLSPSPGRVVVGIAAENAGDARKLIADQSLPYHIIANKGAAMILPEGVDKASGLRDVLQRAGIPPADVIAVGDAENDLDMLQLAGLGVAVQNAIDPLKAIADLVTTHPNGAGVAELIRLCLHGLPNALLAGRMDQSQDREKGRDGDDRRYPG